MTTAFCLLLGAQSAQGQTLEDDLRYVRYDTGTECEVARGRGKLGPEFVVVRALTPPDHFTGNVTFDSASGRLWLISFGPPTNVHEPSTLYELDPDSGRVLARADLPLTGRFGNAIFRDGTLYQGVSHESKLYRISVDSASFGKILSEIALPTLLDLDLELDELVRYPFIAFSGATRSGDQLLIHAEDVGSLLRIDLATGRIISRVPTTRALRGISSLRVDGRELVLANADPSDARRKVEERRFMFRGIHGIYPLTPECLRVGERAVYWGLVDAETGAMISESPSYLSRVPAGSIAFVRHEKAEGTKFGKITFYTISEQGIVLMEWTPQSRME